MQPVEDGKGGGGGREGGTVASLSSRGVDQGKVTGILLISMEERGKKKRFFRDIRPLFASKFSRM